MTNKERLLQKIQKNEKQLDQINKKIERLESSKKLLVDKLEAQNFALKHIKVEKEIVEETTESSEF